MIQHYTHLLSMYFPVEPDSAIFNRDAPDYTVGRVIARYETTGSRVELYNARYDAVFLDMCINRIPFRVRKLLGMKAWGSRSDAGGFLHMAVDDSQKPTVWQRVDIAPYSDVRYMRRHMAGQNITDVVFEYLKDAVQLSVWSGAQLLLSAVRPREEGELAAFFDGVVEGE